MRSDVYHGTECKQRGLLVIIGHVGYDTIWSHHVKGQRIIGGAAFYAAVGAACFTKRAVVVTRIPANDGLLDRAIQSLSLPVSGVKKVSGPASHFTVRYSDVDATPCGATYDNILGCGAGIEFSDVPVSLVAAPFIHLGTAPPQQQLRWVTDLRSAVGNASFVSVDTTLSFIRQYLDKFAQIIALSDLLFVNEHEYSQLLSSGIAAKATIVKKGSRGAESRDEDSLQHEVLAPEVQCVDDTGAGDVLAGAFMANLALGSEPFEALYRAVKTASLSVTQLGVQHLVQP